MYRLKLPHYMMMMKHLVKADVFVFWL